MLSTRETIQQFYVAVVKRDMAGCRRYLRDDLQFEGLFETYKSADAYLAALTMLLQITVRLDVKTIIAEGDEAVLLFDLETKAPAAGMTLVAEWHRVKEGKIARVQSVFDGRPFAAMFSPAPNRAKDEQAIRVLNETFAKALLAGDAKLRASVWTEDGTVLPPNGGLCIGRPAMETHFATEAGSVTQRSKATFRDYRFRFIGQDVAFVDAELILNDVLGPDGRSQPVVPVSIVFTAVRQDGAWFIQDERAFFKMTPTNQ